MPIIWRYLLGQYFKIFAFCTITFVSILLTTRLDDIAHFATLGPSIGLILKFTFLQVPYILPIAIPLSCLISSVIIFQNLSIRHELTALRAAGFSLKKIFSPILISALLLSTLNFYIVSELATSSHLQTSLLKNEIRSVNPLLLLRNKHLMRAKGYFFDTLGDTHAGESASGVLLATPNKDGDRINLMIAEQLTATADTFSGGEVSIITSVQGSSQNEDNQLIIENVKETTTSIEDFTKMVEKKVWSLNNDHLSLPFLLVRLNSDWNRVSTLKNQNAPQHERKHALRNCHRCISELLKRISVGLAPFTFTLMGATFALSISRQKSKRSFFVLVILSALYLVSFFAAQSFSHQLPLSTALYFVPHIFIVSLSLWSLSRTSQGYESRLL